MKNKKNYSQINSFFILTGFFILIFSCKQKDSCNIPCFNGVCIDNSCNCTSGYEGDSCTILTTEKFIGDWSANDACDTINYKYTATIAASTSLPNELMITNFGEFGTTFVIKAQISGFTFTVPEQLVQGITLSGNGTVDTTAKIIVVSYTAMDELNNISVCTGSWIKL
ncbi:MAG: hypothetical protein ABIQ74_08610 [Chitinophagales bacterium]